MIFSKYNIYSKIIDSDNSFIINLLSGNADILGPEEVIRVNKLLVNELEDSELTGEFIEKGYLVDEKEENKTYLKKYLDFIDSRDKDEVQIFFVPNYNCNFACSYCYQDQYSYPKRYDNIEYIDAFFNYVIKEFAGRKKYITIFGGEPLLNSPQQKVIISKILEQAAINNLDLCFVTNGYYLEDYIHMFEHNTIREIQVTLDGTSEIHNSRRFLKGGSGTFDQIVRGIDACLMRKITVNLRFIADKENINNLPDFARFSIEKGWTSSTYFKTQIGRNYELHHCQSSPDKLFNRISLYSKIYEIIREHPHVLEFYKPAFSITKFLQENGELPDPLFDSCPACKTEWAFDYTGHIYSCTATVGKTAESLGTYYPEETKNIDIIAQWEDRDVTNIPECVNCNVQLACGGGCGSIARNRTGKINSPDCRPVKELLEYGFSHYFQRENVVNY
jgi:uncharacterized protein